MPTARVEISPDKQALKADAKALIRAFGGVEAAALVVRASKSSLSEYGMPDNECFMPCDVQADLEDRTHGKLGHPIMTRAQAKRQGYALVALPRGDLPTGADLHAAVAAQSRSAGLVTSNLIEALADRVVTPAEARDGMLKCFEAAEDLMRLHAMLEQIAEVG